MFFYHKGIYRLPYLKEQLIEQSIKMTILNTLSLKNGTFFMILKCLIEEFSVLHNSSVHKVIESHMTIK